MQHKIKLTKDKNRGYDLGKDKRSEGKEDKERKKAKEHETCKRKRRKTRREEMKG